VSPAQVAPRRVTWRSRVRDLLLVALAFAIGGIALTAFAAYRVWDVGQQDNRRNVDAIVVLGAAQYNGRPSGVLAARLDHAIELYQAGYARWFVVTGGKLPGDRVTEAKTERDYAVAHGVPGEAIIGETTGGTTLESMQNVKALFDQKGIHTALFVSDRTHMLRVLRLAQDQGIEAWGSPATTSPADTDSHMHFNALMHELGALGYYTFLSAEPADNAPAADATAPAPASARTSTQPTAASPTAP
jgi:uncharacterized SAM-binding protein YcdF (DUF218 family)